jgi:hypothetical protein
MTCNDPEMWVERSLRVRIWKRHADIKFELPSYLIDQLETVTGNLNSSYVPAQSYLTFYDHVFPEKFLPDSVGLSLLSLFVGSIYTGYIRYVQTLSNLAWRIQLLQHLEDLNVSDENMINATTCKTVDRIKLAVKFLWIFMGVIGSIYAWCVVRLVQSGRTKKPPLAPYPELDLAIKLVRSGDSGANVLFDSLTKDLSIGAVTDHLKDVRLHISPPVTLLKTDDPIPLGPVNNLNDPGATEAGHA